MLSPLELEQATLTNLEIRVSSAWDQKPLPDDIDRYEHDIDTNIRKRRSHWDFRVSMDVSFHPKDGEICRFDLVRVGLVGLFSMPDDVTEEVVEKLVPLNCLAILYGIARGIVAQSSGMVLGGPFILPPVNLVETLKQKRKRTPVSSGSSEEQTQ